MSKASQRILRKQMTTNNNYIDWKLFIDDERFPTDTSFVIARSSEEAFKLLKEKGFPSHIAFDHDLGGDDTSIKFIWRFIDDILDNENTGTALVIPDKFTYSIHSQNPVGAENIKNLMDDFLRFEYKMVKRFTR